MNKIEFTNCLESCSSTVSTVRRPQQTYDRSNVNIRLSDNVQGHILEACTEPALSEAHDTVIHLTSGKRPCNTNGTYQHSSEKAAD